MSDPAANENQHAGRLEPALNKAEEGGSFCKIKCYEEVIADKDTRRSVQYHWRHTT